MCNSDYASKQLNKIRNRITEAASSASREASEIRLIGASKQQNAALLKEFANHGLSDLGENYLQEAVEKQSQMASFDLCWHYIGTIQSNKTKAIAEHFDWVHGVDRLKIATRLASHRTASERDRPVNLLIQVDIDDEPSKGGIPYDQAAQLADQIAPLDSIRLRGYMLIPRAREDQDQQRRVFEKAKELLELSNQQYGLSLDSLSMGMSGDLEAAIAAGSTMVRIGTDLFGARPAKTKP